MSTPCLFLGLAQALYAIVVYTDDTKILYKTVTPSLLYKITIHNETNYN